MRVSSKAEKQNRTNRKEKSRVRLKPEQSISVSTGRAALVKVLKILHDCSQVVVMLLQSFDLVSTVILLRRSFPRKQVTTNCALQGFIQKQTHFVRWDVMQQTILTSTMKPCQLAFLLQFAKPTKETNKKLSLVVHSNLWLVDYGPHQYPGMQNPYRLAKFRSSMQERIISNSD